MRGTGSTDIAVTDFFVPEHRTVPVAPLRNPPAGFEGPLYRMWPWSGIIAGMICFFAIFTIALGLGAWPPNILAERGFTIAKSLNSIFWMTLAFPCAAPGSIVAGCSWYHAGRLLHFLLAQKLEEYTL
jgi:hypothetical protein